MRLNAGTLAIEAEATLPKDKKGEQIGVFGVGVDNAHNQVWTTNTLAETVTVYDAKTLSVVKVFPEDRSRIHAMWLLMKPTIGPMSARL